MPTMRTKNHAPQRDLFPLLDKEAPEQASLFQWAEWNLKKYPELKWLYASNQGIALGGELVPKKGDPRYTEAERLEIQARAKRTAQIRGKQMQRQGLKKGVFDVCLPVKRDPYSGLYIEMKAKDRGMTTEQEDFKAFVESQDFKTAVCYGWDKAVDVIERYLNGRH